MAGPDDDLPFDPAELRARYRAERDRRLRADGNDPYLEVAGELSRFAQDRYAAAPAPRAPLTDEVDVVLVGGGFGGLLAGARLRQAGVGRVRIVEKGAQVGGTWYWNQYPGAQCDIESYIYLPLLEETGYVPSEKYARAREILGHAHRIADHFDLHQDTVLQTEVTELVWDDDAGRWTVHTDRGDAMRAKYVAMATGPLHRPKLPGVPGIEDFAGHAFHTSRWDYGYTGGGPEGGLDRLGDRRVAVIGTGATAVQCVPHLGEAAAHLYVFQRTPSSVDERGNAPTPDGFAAGLAPGWHRDRVQNFNAILSGLPQATDLVDDGWTDIVGRMVAIYRDGRHGAHDRPFAEVLELANMEKMEELRARVDELVHDPATAEALKPWYAMFCKRPCFNDEYLPTFNRPNVTLVDTAGKGVERLTRDGVVVDGTEYPVDCIVFATGFEVGTDYERRAGFRVVGRDGRTLTEKWSQGGMRTLHGMHTHGYPNLFVMGMNQGAWTANYTQLLDEAATHVAYVVSHAEAHGVRTVEATRQAEEDWSRTIVEHAAGGIGGGIGGSDCTPGYYNNEGRELDGPPWAAPYGGGSIAFFDLMQAWREAGDLAGLDLT
ncbi:MAG: flavin-containing monooxygenase [Actinomycetes bacterium]